MTQTEITKGDIVVMTRNGRSIKVVTKRPQFVVGVEASGLRWDAAYFAIRPATPFEAARFAADEAARVPVQIPVY